MHAMNISINPKTSYPLLYFLFDDSFHPQTMMEIEFIQIHCPIQLNLFYVHLLNCKMRIKRNRGSQFNPPLTAFHLHSRRR